MAPDAGSEKVPGMLAFRHGFESQDSGIFSIMADVFRPYGKQAGRLSYVRILRLEIGVVYFAWPASPGKLLHRWNQ